MISISTQIQHLEGKIMKLSLNLFSVENGNKSHYLLPIPPCALRAKPSVRSGRPIDRGEQLESVEIPNGGCGGVAG